MTPDQLKAELDYLIEIMRDDIDRAENLGRGTISIFVARCHIAQLEALAKQAEREVANHDDQ